MCVSMWVGAQMRWQLQKWCGGCAAQLQKQALMQGPRAVSGSAAECTGRMTATGLRPLFATLTLTLAGTASGTSTMLR